MACRYVCRLVDDVEASVRHECLRNADAFRGLVVLEQRSHDARQGESGAVERVAERHLLVGVAVAAVQTVGLVAFEV